MCPQWVCWAGFVLVGVKGCELHSWEWKVGQDGGGGCGGGSGDGGAGLWGVSWLCSINTLEGKSGCQPLGSLFSTECKVYK